MYSLLPLWLVNGNYWEYVWVNHEKLWMLRISSNLLEGRTTSLIRTENLQFHQYLRKKRMYKKYQTFDPCGFTCSHRLLMLCRFPQIWEVQHSPASCSCEHTLQPHSARVCRIPVAGGHGHHSWGARNISSDSWHRSHSERTNRKENIFENHQPSGKKKDTVSC